MKVAVVYNRGTGNVINLFGMPNREKIGLATIGRIVSALKSGGHQVVAIEGDKRRRQGSDRPARGVHAARRQG